MSDEPTVTAVRLCKGCGRPTKGSTWCSRGCWIRSAERLRRIREWRAARKAAGLPIDPPPPSPEQIQAECAEIRKGWTAADFGPRRTTVIVRRTLPRSDGNYCACRVTWRRVDARLFGGESDDIRRLTRSP